MVSIILLINNNDEKILENNNLISNYEKINKYYNRILKIAIAISPLIGAAVSIGIKAIAGVVASKFILSTTILIALFEGVSIVHNRCSLQDHKKRFKKEHFNNENITKEEMKEKIEKKNKELVKENKNYRFKKKCIEDKIRKIKIKMNAQKKAQQKSSESRAFETSNNKKYVDGDSYNIKSGNVNLKRYGGRK